MDGVSEANENTRITITVLSHHGHTANGHTNIHAPRHVYVHIPTHTHTHTHTPLVNSHTHLHTLKTRAWPGILVGCFYWQRYIVSAYSFADMKTLKMWLIYKCNHLPINPLLRWLNL